MTSHPDVPHHVLQLSRIVVALISVSVVWAALFEIDIVAEAPGRIIPTSMTKQIQAAETAVVKEVLVKPGARVKAGAIIARLDPESPNADLTGLNRERHQLELNLRRNEAERLGTTLVMAQDDPLDLYQLAAGQLDANRQTASAQLASETAQLQRATSELASAKASRAKLMEILPVYQEADKAYETLTKEGFSGRLLWMDKQRERMEKERELAIANQSIATLTAAVSQQQARVSQVKAEQAKALDTERTDLEQKLTQAQAGLTKSQVRVNNHDVTAPYDGIVKEVMIQAKGSVVGPGTLVATLVPVQDELEAEIIVRQEDIGFVEAEQDVALKIVALPFQKYGLLAGKVKLVTADAIDKKQGDQDVPNGYRALVTAKATGLTRNGKFFPLKPGMAVAAEIKLGKRTVLEYLLSPIKKITHEALSEK